MPRFIVTGCYTGAAFKGMIANPSDREAAARGLIETCRRQARDLLHDDRRDRLHLHRRHRRRRRSPRGPDGRGRAGAISDVRTQRAFTAAEFMAIQKKAGGLAANYKAPN